ncbi:hypothetical protein MGG_18009, partial [Pyricularia oryzae 70-15]
DRQIESAREIGRRWEEICILVDAELRRDCGGEKRVRQGFETWQVYFSTVCSVRSGSVQYRVIMIWLCVWRARGTKTNLNPHQECGRKKQKFRGLRNM